MIYFRNTPTALNDLTTVEDRLLSTLSELEDHEKSLLAQFEEALKNAESQIDNIRRRTASSNGLSIINGLGEFQTNPVHRADVILMQIGVVHEMIVQIRYILDPTTTPKKEEKKNEQRSTGQRVRKAAQPRKQVGKRAAVRRPGKQDGG